MRRLRLVFACVLLASVTSGCGGGGTTYAFQTDFPGGVQFGPQVARPAPTSMTIAWQTVVAVVGSVEYGADAGYGSVVTDGSTRAHHALVVSGLAPATTYHYRIVNGGMPAGGDHTFRTPPSDPATPFRFVALGDTGTGTAPEADAIARLRSLSPDFVLNTGDVAYSNGSGFDVRTELMIPFAHVLDSIPLFPVIGNHDSDMLAGQPLLDAMVLPTNSADGTSRFYSFDWANTHFVALDSNSDSSPSSRQGQWLRQDLAAATATWTIVFFHHPAYSSSRHGGDPTVDANFVPVLDDFHVDLVLNGHDHDYERTFPLLGGVPITTGDPDYTDPAGTVYVVTGGGGKTLYDAGTSAFTAYSESVHHVTQVDIAGPTLHLTAVRSDGTVMDEMSITKSP